MRKHSSKLPKEVQDSLKRILKFIGNEKAAEEDPDKVLAILLYGIEEFLGFSKGTGIGFIVWRYCSNAGLVRFARKLEEKKIA